MKHLIFSLLIALLPAIAGAQKVELVSLKNYFVKNTVKLSKGYNCNVISKKSTFDKNFGAAKTATNTIVTPDFKDHWVVSVALPATNITTDLHIEKAEISGSNLNVRLVKQTGTQQTYSTTPLALAMLSRNANIKYVCFYDGSKMIKKIKV
ncbi:hypothetical protein [Taibaiella soli]|uniref:T9SS C-terminal target domain-containing protein n=1 Tax=Taibaiella soli TaxID=1649169 RepID=A0A2W2BCH7_9BACT|nr:hypothetical protein [Taibaiella soli]PZF71366.1 hypothetical protein DN068_18915 [Taibaiella soli]